MFRREGDSARQYAPGTRGLELQSVRAVIPASSMFTLRTVAVNILPNNRVRSDEMALPVRVIVWKPAGGTAYTVPNTTLLKLVVAGSGFPGFPLAHIEVSPNLIGVGQSIDQVGEYAAINNEPSFSWTGFAGNQGMISTGGGFNNFGKGFDLMNAHATTDISGATTAMPIYLRVYFHLYQRP